MICDKCKEDAYHLKYDLDTQESYCARCWGMSARTEGAPLVQVFEPYEMTNGPKHMIPMDDPNRKKWFSKEGKYVCDNDSIVINTKREEKKYLEMMGAHQAERGEDLMGIKAEFKDKPRGRIYSFAKKSCSSR